MRNIDIKVPVVEKSYDELSEAERSLIAAARKAVEGSYAPYSNFHVGAAIRLANGEIATGANQENAAYPSGTCAERTACFWAGAHFAGVPFECIAIAAADADWQPTADPISPCGACRQALIEYEKLASHDVPLLLAGANRVLCLPSVRSLLPLAFTDF